MNGAEYAYWEQADYWNIPYDYVHIVHKVYERTRWDDVQGLRRAARKICLGEMEE